MQSSVHLSVQAFHYTDLDQIVYEDDLCLDVPRSKLKNPVEIQICHFMGGNQKWKYDNQVRNKEQCLKGENFMNHEYGQVIIRCVMSVVQLS